jgi:hypothetical protein
VAPLVAAVRYASAARDAGSTPSGSGSGCSSGAASAKCCPAAAAAAEVPLPSRLVAGGAAGEAAMRSGVTRSRCASLSMTVMSCRDLAAELSAASGDDDPCVVAAAEPYLGVLTVTGEAVVLAEYDLCVYLLVESGAKVGWAAVDAILAAEASSHKGGSRSRWSVGARGGVSDCSTCVSACICTERCNAHRWRTEE